VDGAAGVTHLSVFPQLLQQWVSVANGSAYVVMLQRLSTNDKGVFSHIVEYVSWVHSHAYTLGHFQRLIGLADSCSAHFINCKSYVCYSASYCALRYYMCFFLSPVWTVLLWCYPVCFHFLLLFHYFVVIYSMFNKCCRYTSRMGILHL